MKKNSDFKFIIFILGLFSIIPIVNAQITSGKITYERKTNLHKKFKNDPFMNDWIKKQDKNKIDVFELYFNDSLSFFKPQENELYDDFSWATNKNTVYQDFKNRKRLSIKNIEGETFYISDSLLVRKWKITGSKRNICGYNCRKAIWQANDSIRFYAWYCNEIITNTGPESFLGLPGAILGLATEDGGVIYFAKTIESMHPDTKTLLPPKTKNKIYPIAEFRTKLEKSVGKYKWGKIIIKEALDF